MADLIFFLPVLIVGLGAILLMLLAAFENIDDTTACYGGMAVFLLGFFAQLLCLSYQETVMFAPVFNAMLTGNGLTTAAGLIITGCGFFTCMSSESYFRQNRFFRPEYYALIAFAACGMMVLTMARELITAFIALEIMSLAVYVLVGMHRENVRATEAVLKYLILGAFAGGFYTMGTALIYGGTGTTHFAAISQMMTRELANEPLLLSGSLLVVVALLFKAAAFPFHAWAVDVYDGAALPVTGFMATALKTAVFVVFANFLALNSGMQASWVDFLFAIAVFTMFAGNLIAMGQNNLKRMLAASGIVHSGYLLIALIAFTSEDFTRNILLYYLAAYAIATLGMFCALSYLSGEGAKRRHFDDFKGLAKVRPYSAAAIAVFLLSMAGLPPTVGFMGKVYLIVGALNAGQTALAALAIVSSIFSLWYYLRLIIIMYFHEAKDDFATHTSSYAPLCTFVLVICAFVFSLLPLAA